MDVGTMAGSFQKTTGKQASTLNKYRMLHARGNKKKKLVNNLTIHIT